MNTTTKTVNEETGMVNYSIPFGEGNEDLRDFMNEDPKNGETLMTLLTHVLTVARESKIEDPEAPDFIVEFDEEAREFFNKDPKHEQYFDKFFKLITTAIEETSDQELVSA